MNAEQLRDRLVASIVARTDLYGHEKNQILRRIYRSYSFGYRELVRLALELGLSYLVSPAGA